MATYYLRPDGVISSAWNLNGAASANAALNGTAVQPTAGDTTQFISSNTSAQVTEVTLGTITLGGGESVTSVKVWEYGKADTLASGHAFQAYKGTTALGTAGAVADGDALAWRSSTYTGALTQAEVDDLRIRFTEGGGGLGSNYAYEAYVELTTVITPALSPAASGVASCSAAVTAAPRLAPSSPAAVGAASAAMTASAQLAPAPAAAASVSASAEVGAIPKWKAAFRKYKAGTGTATVVAIGDSLTEGYYGGANVRSADGWPVRAGLNLSRIGDPTIHPGVYLPTNWATITQTGSTALFLDPSGTDPWTRAGQVNNFIGQRGLGDKIAQLYFTGATLTTTAPSWATHALIHFTDDSSGSGSVWQALSNGVLVYQHVMDSTPNEQTVLVPLQGAGNSFALNLPGTQGGNGNPSFSGVVFQQRKNAPITPMYSAAGHNTLGGATSVSLTSVVTGALMVVLAAYDGSLTPATPAGWTSLGSQLVGTHGYRLCYRVKQSGDTTVTFSPGGTGSSDVSLVALNGASVGQVVGPTTATASSTTIASPAMDATSSYSWSLLALGAGQSGDTVTFPSGWTQQASSNSNIVVALGTDATPPSDLHFAPGSATLASNPAVDRISWQVEITQASTPVTESFVQVIENGHGGYEANSYANPAGGNLPPLSADTNYYWAEAAGKLKPDLVVIYLGYNDIAQGRTASQFQTDLQTMVTKIDLKFGYQPDLLFVIHLYLAGNSIGFTHTQWDAFVTAMQTAAATYGTRAKTLKIEDYWRPSPGPDDFTTLEPGTSSTAVHPTPFGQRTMGDVIAATLADSFVQLAPASTGVASSSATATTPAVLTCTTSGAGSASASATISVALTPSTAAAIASVSATAVAVARVTATATAVGSSAATAVVPVSLAPSASTAVATTSATTTASSQMSGTTTSVGAATATTVVPVNISPSASGVGSVTSGIQVPGVAFMAPSPAAAIGDASATLSVPVPATASTSAAGASAASASVAQRLAPAPAAVATALAIVGVPIPVTPSAAAGTGSATGAMTVTENTSPDPASIVASATMSMSVAQALTAEADATADSTLDVTATGRLVLVETGATGSASLSIYTGVITVRTRGALTGVGP